MRLNEDIEKRVSELDKELKCAKILIKNIRTKKEHKFILYEGYTEEEYEQFMLELFKFKHLDWVYSLKGSVCWFKDGSWMEIECFIGDEDWYVRERPEKPVKGWD